MRIIKTDSEKGFFNNEQEHWEQTSSIQKSHQILEESVRDLKYVDISNSLYIPVKRCLDIVFSAIGILTFLIPMLIISVLIYFDDPGRIIFSQYRVGRNGKLFKVYKFRSMKKTVPKYIAAMDLKDPQRCITRVGRILRKLSLDELPQLWNVLKGDMSLIGPRPLIPSEYDIHTMRMRFGVYNVRPGITGLAQINGRDKILPQEKLQLDVRYLQEFSFWSDLKIVLLTVPAVLLETDAQKGN